MTDPLPPLTWEEAQVLYRTHPLPDDLTPQERRWHAMDQFDPRPYCPNRAQHAVVLYGDRWTDSGYAGGTWPRLDGKSVQRTHKQVRCPWCRRYAIWVQKPSGKSGQE